MEQQPLYPPQPQFSPTPQVNPAAVTPPPAPEPAPPQKHRVKLILLIVAVTLFVVTLGAYGVWYFVVPKNTACLTRDDYQAIAGEALPDDAPFSPSVDFYGLEVEFNSDTKDFTDSEAGTEIKAIGQFAKEHPGTSLLVSIQAMYTDETKTITEERITAISTLLTEAGVNTKAISTSLKPYSASDSLDDNFDDVSGDIVSIAITSSETCQ